MSTAADLYLKLTAPGDQPINGESLVVGFKDQIELTDWKWQLRHTENTSRAEPTVFQFSKIMDRATTAMLAHMQKGTHLTADVTLQDSSVDNAFSLILRLKEVRIVEYSFNIKAADDQKEGHVEEDWTFDYASIEFDFQSQEDKGSAKVQLVRPAGSSTDAPAGLTQKMLKMAGGMSVGQLDELWEALKRDADKRRLHSDAKAGDAKHGDAKQKQPGR